jgi:hypothetical protein
MNAMVTMAMQAGAQRAAYEAKMAVPTVAQVGDRVVSIIIRAGKAPIRTPGTVVKVDHEIHVQADRGFRMVFDRAGKAQLFTTAVTLVRL